jgi:hypothetical protein
MGFVRPGKNDQDRISGAAMRHRKAVLKRTAALKRFWSFTRISLLPILIGLCCFAQIAHANASGEGGALTEGQIDTAWKAAATRLRAMRVEYVTERTFKVVKDPTRYSAKLKERPPDDLAPPREYLTRISLDGPRVRREVLSKGSGPNGLLKRMSLEVTDGKRIKSLTMPGELSMFSYPAGQNRPANLPLLLYLIDNQPILFVMSRSDPVMAGFRPEFKEFHVTKNAERLDGVECVYLEAGDPKARKKVWVQNGKTYTDGIDPIYSQLWLAPTRDFSVIRYAQFINGRLRERVDLRYRKDETSNWVPESWTLELPKRGDDTETEFRKSRVVKWESNPHLDDSEWDFNFPPDAQVSGQD